ncbi:hypothetical protein [Hymenobacter jejuensis]|uniref:LemA family protein n=1 Tax=Hymenobacter jejuensis TaxID=2502781 RepID=A0A5B8A3Y9_9BACT|nr:hypothetical protein [Hymenobacter jejuensis]QDA61406.1 hypothetical protein FHG12_15445 [Hymenobacter jejuensis]
MRKILPLALLLLLAGLDACNRTPKAVDPASPQAAKVQLDVLRDTVDARWAEMIASDDAKVTATKQVLRELESQPGTDRAQLQQLAHANDRLKRIRYDQQSMAASDKIDAYDSAQDSLLHVLYTVALPNNGQPTEGVKTLTQEIQDTDNQVVGFRVRYDQAAKQFNNYLQLHQEEISSLGGKYSKLQPLPLFELKQ